MKPFFRHTGGKRTHFWLGNWVREIHQVRPFSVYCEPFVGAGGAFWQYAGWLRDNEIRVRLNDADPAVCALWNAMLHRTAELNRELQSIWGANEAVFRRCLDAVAAADDTDTVRLAAAKLFLTQFSYRGAGTHSNFKDLKIRNTLPVLANALEHVRTAKAALEGLEIVGGNVSRQCFSEVLAERRSQFVYADPPYFGTGQHYTHNLTPEQHARLSSLLLERRDGWLLSYDEHPEARRLYQRAWIGTVEARYRCSTKPGKEVLIQPQEQYDALPTV